MEPGLEFVGEAAEPAAALAGMEATQPNVAVIDLSLGRASGLELIKTVRRRLPSIRMLALTMHEDIGDVERALRAGARGYIMKSQSSGQIIPAIRQVQAGRIYASAEILARLAERVTQCSPGDDDDMTRLLSDREREVFRRIGEGRSTSQIASELSVSHKTVQTYCARIKEKLSLDNGRELTIAAIKWCESCG